MKCLIVDDDMIYRILLQEMLCTSFECDLAEDGNEAISLFRTNLSNGQKYDLICMDVTMRGCNGHEALVGIRNIEKEYGVPASKQSKIIMVSGLDDPKTVLDSYCKGVTSYIVKPVQKAKLIQVLKNINLAI